MPTITVYLNKILFKLVEHAPSRIVSEALKEKFKDKLKEWKNGEKTQAKS